MRHVIDQLAGPDLFVAGFMLAIVLGAMGFIANHLLREAGFGVVVNGVLIIVGAAFGVAARGIMVGLQ